MADTATTQDPELQDANLDQSGDNQQKSKPNSNEVKIREPFEIGGAMHIIYDIEVDKKGKKTANWRIKEGSQVEISGSGLEIYDQINLHIAGGVYIHKGIERQAGGRFLGFKVNDEIKDLFAEGAEIELEFVSNANPANNRFLKQKFRYKGESAEEKVAAKKKLAEEQELKQAKAGQSSPGAVSEIINRTIGGVAEAFGQGLVGKPNTPAIPGQSPSAGIKTISQGGATGGLTTDEDIDYEQDFGGELQQQATSGVASTVAQSSVGAEVISQGSTAQGSAVGTETISSGGTVKTSGTVSTGGTVLASQQAQTSGTVSGTQKTFVSGTVTGGGSTAKISQTVSGTSSGGESPTTTQTVSGSKTVSGSEKVSATETVSASQTGSSGAVAGSATQKIQNETSASQKQQATSESGATSQGTITTGGQTTVEAKAETASQVESSVEGQVSDEVQSNENIEVKSKIPATQESEKEKISTEVKQTATGQEQQTENQFPSKIPTSPAPGKGKVDGVEKKPEAETPEKPPDQKNPASAKQPTSTAGFGGGFSATGGTLPTQLGNLSGTLNRFKANEAALGSRLGLSGVKQPSTDAKKQSGQGQNILNNAPQRAPGEKDKAGDTEKEKTDGKIAEEKEEKPLASPMGTQLAQNDAGTGGDQGQSAEQDKATQPGKEKSEQEENQEQEPTGQEGDLEAEQKQEENQEPPIIQKPSSPQALGAAELAEAEKLVNTTVNGYLQSLAIIIWSSALPTFGLSILFGAIVGDILWLLKDWAIKKALSKTPLPKKFSSANVKDFRINFSLNIKAQIAAWNALVVATAIFIFIFILTILWGLCNSWVTYPIRETGLKPICEAIDKSSLGQGLSKYQSTGSFSGSYNTPGTLISTAQWTDQINSSAQKWNIDACILRVVVQKESGGNQSAIGCDCAANGNPQYCPDKRKTYSSDYQFNWNQCSYGIGLTQWTIYPKGGSGYKSWQDANTPSRNLYSAWYGVTDLLDGKTSLDLTAKAFSANLGKANGDIAAAFAAYVGASNVQNQLVADRMALYNICKAGN